jgi:hypothetical protein
MVLNLVFGGASYNWLFLYSGELVKEEDFSKLDMTESKDKSIY